MASNTRVTASNPAGVAAPLKPHYSNCVRVDSGPLLFISGQIATDEKGAIVGIGDLRAQAEQVLKNIETILRSHGATMSDVLNVTVYVTDISAFHSIADIRLRYFPSNGPASTIVEVSSLALPELMVEISAVAAVQ
jgi:enamine deaminase RidA (YjgF/YER057c/UK114 family)